MIEIDIRVDGKPERHYEVTNEEETTSPKGSKVCRYKVNAGFDVWHFPEDGLLVLIKKVFIKVNRQINKTEKRDSK